MSYAGSFSPISTTSELVSIQSLAPHGRGLLGL